MAMDLHVQVIAAAALLVLGGQLLQLILPSSEYVPAEQSEQATASITALDLPAWQFLHLVVLSPNLPFGQLEHSDEPALVANLPAAQGAHSFELAPVPARYVPAGQRTQSLEPWLSCQEPAAHSLHSIS